ncbi:hypothetical protein JB92DRAFT_3092179 [Gautieria morchelliformis]|nr:hypothetical protein JB92DRAFT_3092179 [Gautieria morchelliformis]
MATLFLGVITRTLQLPSLVQGASDISPKHVSWSPRRLNIGIIGASASGLYTAMILQGLGIDYEILEANKTVGGRLFTHHFGEKPTYHCAIECRLQRSEAWDWSGSVPPRFGLSHSVTLHATHSAIYETSASR